MISNFDYITSISNAYKNICEAYSKEVKKLRDTKYKSVYKSDGYDQFGIDINGKDRNGNVVSWRYPDRWNGDAATFEKLAISAMKKEALRNGEVKHNYDRNGFDVLGYDKQGFDIDDRDILGHPGSEYGTAEYDSMAKERERQRHNLHSKNAMREYNYNKSHQPLTQQQEKYIVDAYAKAANSPNPQKTFEQLLKVLFVKQLPNGKISFDRPSFNYFVNKYTFSDTTSINASNMEVINMFILKFKEQLNRMFRPDTFEKYIDVDVVFDGDTEQLNKYETVKCVINVELKEEIIENVEKSRRKKYLQFARIAANRMSILFPYSGIDFWTNAYKNSISIHLVVDKGVHNNISNIRSSDNANSRFAEKYQLGIFDPELSTKIKANRKKSM